MFTRKQYLDKEVDHNTYYGQFVDNGVLAWVKNNIGIEKLRASTDPHFNDIPLSKWDAFYYSPHFSGHVSRALRDSGDVNARSFANACTVAKAAARKLLLDEDAA